MSRVVKIGNLSLGGRNPVRIKGMLKTPFQDTKGLIKEAKRLEQEGAEAIRVAVREKKDASVVKLLKQQITLPLVADIHFHAPLALLAIDQGFDAVRLNPLNIYKLSQVRQIARAAKQRGISIRVGVNSGGFKREFASPNVFASAMLKEIEAYLKVLEGENFFDIMVSLKVQTFYLLWQLISYSPRGIIIQYI